MSSFDIIVISQTLVLNSLIDFKKHIKSKTLLILSTHHLFQNEEQLISKMFNDCFLKIEIMCFADFLTDKDMESCDLLAYTYTHDNLADYYQEIKKLKNQIIIEKIEKQFVLNGKWLLCNDLGIDEDLWVKHGYTRLKLEYYSNKQKSLPSENKIKKIKRILNNPIYTASYEGYKYVFYGNLNRIGYRMSISFKLNKFENFYYLFTVICTKIFGKCICRKNAKHISTLHESTNWIFPEIKGYDVGIIQDGYLPQNYSSLYLKFIKSNEHYYAWDAMGMQLFKNQNIPVELLPFRKKLFMPNPLFKKIKTVLCVASGAGDWTAMKNRSDEDLMIIAFVEIAKKHPDIKFVYRCHPTWTHPQHQGVNSIQRVNDYFTWLALPNLSLSSNVPPNSLSNFRLSFSRKSLEQDLKEADIVFGEHSVSMIDAAFMRIPFASVNMTNRRDFFYGMTNLGFPHCETIEDIDNVLRDCNKTFFRDCYLSAVNKYNMMTDKDQVL